MFEGIEIAWIPDSIKGEGLTQRIKMKSLVDGEGGWVSVDSETGTPVCEEVQKDGSKLPSTGRFFKALKPGLMKEGMNVESAKCGDLDVGEIFEALEIVEIPDTRDGEGLMTRIRMMSKVDGEGGWVSLDTKKGTMLVEEVPRPEAEPEAAAPASPEEAAELPPPPAVNDAQAVIADQASAQQQAADASKAKREAKVRKTRLAMPFDTKNAIILPRQARDKHREPTQNNDAFSLEAGEGQRWPRCKARRAG